MKIFKKFYTWEKKQMKNPETVLAVWVAFGVLFGVGIENVGAGVAVGVAIGVAMSVSQRKKNQEDIDGDSKDVED